MGKEAHMTHWERTLSPFEAALLTQLEEIREEVRNAASEESKTPS
jgi:hypothetical protein